MPTFIKKSMSGIVVRKGRQTKTIGLLCFDEMLSSGTDTENLTITPQQQYTDPSMMLPTTQRPTTRSDSSLSSRRNTVGSIRPLLHDGENIRLKRVLIIAAAIVLGIIAIALFWQ